MTIVLLKLYGSIGMDFRSSRPSHSSVPLPREMDWREGRSTSSVHGRATFQNHLLTVLEGVVAKPDLEELWESWEGGAANAYIPV